MASFDLATMDDVFAAIDDEKQLDPGLVSVNEKRRFVQDALDDLGDLSIFEKTVEAVVTSSPVDLSNFGGSETGFESPIGVYWNGRALPPVDPREINRTSAGANPSGYWIQEDKLYFYPKLAAGASGTLTVEMTRRPPWPAATSAVLDLPKEWRRLLVLYGVYRCHKKNGNKFSADDYKSEYDRAKAQLFNLAIQRRNQRTTSLREPLDQNAMPWYGLGRGI